MAHVEDFYVNVPKNGQESDGEVEKSIHALRLENRLLDNRYNAINRRLLAVSDECKKKCSKWKNKCYKWKNRYYESKDEFYEFEKKYDTLEYQQREIPVLRQKVKDLERSNEQWKGKYDNAEAKRIELEAALSQQRLQTTPIHIQNENRKLKAENEEQSNQITLLNGCLDHLQQRLNVKKATQAQLDRKDTLIRINQTLLRENDKLLHENQQRIVYLEQTDKENKAHISALGVKVKSLQQELMEANNKLNELQTVLDDLERMSDQKEKAIKNLKSENEKISAEKIELEWKCLKLEEGHERKTADLNTDITKLNTKLEEVKRENEKLSTAWRQVKVAVMNNANGDNNNQSIDEQLQQVLTEINEKDKAYNLMNACINDILKQKEKLRKSKEMGQSHNVQNREGEVSNRNALNGTSVCLISPAGDSRQSSSLTVNGTERMDVDTSDSAAGDDILKEFLAPDDATDENTTPQSKMEKKTTASLPPSVTDEDTDTEVDVEND